jgi:hypothetical protein
MTGREILKEIAGEETVEALYARGFVCVPRMPTQEMLDEAYWSALAENAAGVWDEMIKASEDITSIAEISAH